MPNWKKLIVSGSDATLNSLNVTTSVTASSYTGSFVGDGSGLTGLTAAAITSTTNGADNRIATYTDADSLNGEANLTFDGSSLNLVGNLTASGAISASGDIIGSTGKFTNLEDASTFGDGILIKAPTGVQIHDGLSGLITNPARLYVAGNISTNSHITASGNISASGAGTNRFGGPVIIRAAADNLTLFEVEDTDGQNNLTVKVDSNQHTEFKVLRDSTQKIHFNSFHPALIDNDAYESHGGLVLGTDISNTGKSGFGVYVSSGPDSGSIYTADKVFIGAGAATGSDDMLTVGGNINATSHISSSGLYVESSTITDFIKLNSLGSSANPIKLIFEKASSEQGIIEYNRNGDLEIYNTDGDGGVMIDGSTSAGGDLYVANSGKVGIGNTSPPKELTVEGDISGSGTLLLEGGITASGNIQGASITIGTDTVYSNALNIHNSGAIRIGNAEYISKSGNDLSLFQGRVKVHNEGRGTTFDGSITASADISASGDITGGGTTSGATGSFGTAGTAGSVILTDTGAESRITAFNNHLVLRTQRDQDDIKFQGGASTTQYALIEGNTGYVGIGITSPSENLHVSESVRIGYPSGRLLAKATDSSYGEIIPFNSSGQTIINNQYPDGVIIFKSGSNEVARFKNGRLGIGTSSPQSGFLLDVNGNAVIRDDIYVLDNLIHFGTDDFEIRTSGGSDILFQTTGSTERMRITDDGNVGIGTSNPSKKLTVEGDISASGASISGDTTITGDLQVGGTIQAEAFHTTITSSSILLQSGSTRLGDTLDDIHTITGSLNITGSQTIDIGGRSLVFDSVSGFARISANNSLFIGGGDTSLIQFSNDAIPDGDSTRDLGSTSRYWAELYVDSIIASGAISGSGTGSFDNIAIPGSGEGYYLGGSGGGAPTDTLRLGSKTAGNTIALELFHATNPVSLGVSYDGGDAIAFVDSVHSSFDSVLQFKTGGSERFRIGALNATTFQIKPASAGNDVEITDNSGNAILYSDTSTQKIGIGNSVPPEKLTVEGNVSASGDFVGVSGSFDYVKTGRLQVGSATNSTDKLTIDGGDLHLENQRSITFADIGDGNEGRVRIKGDEDNDFIDLAVDNNNNKNIRLDGTGVGIYTTVPAVTGLTVGGDISGSGDLTMLGTGSLEYLMLGGATSLTEANTRLEVTGQINVGGHGNSGVVRAHKGKFGQIVNRTSGTNIIEFTGGNNVSILGPITASGDISAAGSTKFGDDISDTHSMTGSLNISGSVVLRDNTKLQLGSNSTAGDLRIFHDGSTSQIANNTGHLQVIQYVNDGDIVFKSDDGSGGITEYFRLDGGVAHSYFSKSVIFEDDVELKIGSGNDLNIYHDGSNSYIRTQNAGDLIVQTKIADGDIKFQTGSTEFFRLDGGFGSPQTIFPDNSQLNFGNGLDLRIVHDGSDSTIESNGTGNLIIQQKNNDSDIIFKSDDGSGGLATYFFLDGSTTDVRFEKSIRVVDNSKIKLGTGEDLQIYHDGSNNKIQTVTAGVDLEFISGSTEFLRLDGGTGEIIVSQKMQFGDNVKAVFGNGEDLDIFHDGSESKINNAVGTLKIQQEENDGDIVFQSDNGSGGITAYYTIDGGEVKNIFSKDVVVNADVSASGNISGSKIFGTHFSAGNNTDLSLDLNTSDAMQFRVGGASRITHTSTIFRPSTDEAVSLGRPAQKWKELVVNHITASGNISSSGTGVNTFNGDIKFDGDAIIGTLNQTDDIQISPAAKLNLGTTNSDEINIGRTTGTVDVNVFAGSSTAAATFLTEQITFNHPITASANISSSGNIKGGTLNITSAENELAVFESTDQNSFITIKDSNANTNLVHSLHAFKIQVDPSDSDGSSNFRVEVDGTEALRINNSQRVGIGNTAPPEKLTVEGNISASGNLTTVGNVTVGGDLTIDGTLTAQEFHSEFVSSSILFQSGSTKLGDSIDDVHSRTGSINLSGSLNLTDNTRIVFGSGISNNDFNIYHDGTTSRIQNTTGDVRFINFQDDGDIIFQSDDGSGGITEYFRVDGGLTETIFSVATRHMDDAAIKIGSGEDLAISHDGTDTKFVNNKAGSHIKFLSGSTEYLRFDGSGGDIEFYQDLTNAANKNLVMGGGQAKFSDSGRLFLGDSNDLQIYHNGTNSHIDNYVGSLSIRQFLDDGDILFSSDDGSGGTAEYFRVDGGNENILFSKNVVINADLSASNAITGSTLNLQNIVNAGEDTDKFLVLDSSGNVDFRTGANLASDIGAVTSGVSDAGGATDQVAVWSSASAISGSNNFSFDTTNNRLELVGDISGSGTGSFEGGIRIGGTNGTTAEIVDSFGEKILFELNDLKVCSKHINSEFGVFARSVGSTRQMGIDGSSTCMGLYTAGHERVSISQVGNMVVTGSIAGTHITASGNISATAGALSVTADGSNAATLTESGDGDFTIAAVDDLRLDAGGNDIVLRGASSSEFGRLTNSSQDFVIRNITSDKDIIFKGNDGGSTITAMTLDISEGGRLGIGTTLPKAKLHISGSNSTESAIRQTRAGVVIWDQAIDSSGRLQWGTRATEGGTRSVHFTLDDNSNVGIGTGAPSAPLHVKPASGGNGEISIERDSGTLINLQAQAALGVIGTDTNHDLAFKTNSSVGMRLTTSGRVGIGISSPSMTLDVRGNQLISGSGTQLLRVESADTSLGDEIAQFKHQDGTHNPRLLVSSTSTGMKLSTSFTTGIAGSFDLQSNGGSSYIALSTNGTNERMRINSSGDVGIGTSSPVEALTVVGNISSSNNVGVGGKLTFHNHNLNVLIGSDNMSTGSASGCRNIVVGAHSNTGKCLTDGDDNIIMGTATACDLTTGCYNVALGLCALKASTTGSCNIAIGFRTLLNANGVGRNLAIGTSAGCSVTTGTQNTLIGCGAGKSITTGNNNVALGNNAGKCITTGERNVNIQGNGPSGSACCTVIIGQAAGGDRVPSHTVLVGPSAGMCVAGVNNTAVGANALRCLDKDGSISDSNTAIGEDTMCGAKCLNSNTAVGSQAMRCSVSASFNVAIGQNAAKAAFCQAGTLSRYNTVVGTQAMQSVVSGSCNVALGFCAGRNSAAGTIGSSQNSIFIGHQACSLNTSSTNEIVIGGTAVGLGNNSVLLGNDSTTKTRLKGAVGIGIDTTDSALLHVSSSCTRKAIIEGSNGSALLRLKRTDQGKYFDLSLEGNDLRFTPGTLDNSQNVLFGVNAGSEKVASRVGIGHPNPESELHVSGSTILDGGISSTHTITGSLKVTGSIHTSDNSTIKVGNASGGDLQIYHNGSHSLISNQTGDLFIRNQTNDGDIKFQADDGSGGDTEYFRLDGGRASGGDTFTIFGDNSYIELGDDSDGRIVHTGTSMFIQAFTGDLEIQNNATDGDILFRSDDGSGGLNTYMFLDGGNQQVRFTSRSRHLDNVRAEFGTGGDLDIYHDGTDSYIDNNGGDLYIMQQANDKDISFQGDNGSGGTTEYFRLDGSDERTIASKPFRFIDTISAEFGTGLDMQIYHSGGEGTIQNYTGALRFIQSLDNGDIQFFSDDGLGGTNEYLRIDGGTQQVIFSSESLHSDNVKAKFGTGGDLQIFHDGNNSFINDNGTGDLYIQTNGTNMFLRDKSSGNTFIAMNIGTADVSLKQGGNTKLTTTSDGAKVFGNLEVTGTVQAEQFNTTIVSSSVVFQSGSTQFGDSVDDTHNITGSLNVSGSTNFIGDVSLGDSTKLILGDSSDIQIQSDNANQLFDFYNLDNVLFRQNFLDGDMSFLSDDGSGGTATYFKLDGGNTRVQFNKDARFVDNAKVMLGTGDDLEIFHDGTNNKIVSNADKLRFYSSSAEFFRMQGGANEATLFTKNLRAQDNVRIDVGGSTDGRFFHDGTDTFLTTITGDLIIRNSNDDGDIKFMSDDGLGGTNTYFRVDGGEQRTIFHSASRHNDNIRAYFGTGEDLTIRHDGSDSIIENSTGTLRFTNKADSEDIVFQTDDGSGGVTTYFRLDGSATTSVFEKDARFNDNIELNLGNAGDLKIRHNATNSEIISATGDLIIKTNNADGDIKFQSGSTEYFRVDSSHEATRFGNPIIFDDNVRLNFGTDKDLHIRHNGSGAYITNGTGDLQIQNDTNDGDIKFRSDDGSGDVTDYYVLDGGLSANIFYKRVKLVDNVEAQFGNNPNLKIYSDGTDNYIQTSTADGDIKFRSGSTEFFRLDGGSGNMQLRKDLFVVDNAYLNIGNNFDLRLVHDGSDSIIQAQGDGNLIIRQTVNDGDIKFMSDNGLGGYNEYLRIDGGDQLVKFFSASRHEDNVKARFGTGGDLYIEHNGTKSLIVNTNGDLDIQNQHDDGDILFKSDDGSGGVTEYFRLDGGLGYSVSSQHIQMADGKAVYYGNGNDLGIYHLSNNSFIENQTGDLFIQTANADGDIKFRSGSTEFFRLDGGANGTIYSKPLKLLDSTNINIGGSNDLKIYHDGSDSYLEQSGTGDLVIKTSNSSGDIKFQSGSVDFMFMDSSQTAIRMKRLTKWDDNIKATFGDGEDLQIYHDGTDSYIDDSGTGDLRIRSSFLKIEKYTGETMATFNDDNAVSLYFNNTKRLETTTLGATVTGQISASGCALIGGSALVGYSTNGDCTGNVVMYNESKSSCIFTTSNTGNATTTIRGGNYTHQLLLKDSYNSVSQNAADCAYAKITGGFTHDSCLILFNSSSNTTTKVTTTTSSFAGPVGIGTTTPGKSNSAVKFEVVGSVSASSNIHAREFVVAAQNANDGITFESADKKPDIFLFNDVINVGNTTTPRNGIKFNNALTGSHVSMSGIITAEQLTTSDDLTVGDDINLSTGGRVYFDGAGGGENIYATSNNLELTAGNNVNINTSNQVTIKDASNPTLEFHTNDSSVSSGDSIGNIFFQTADANDIKSFELQVKATANHDDGSEAGAEAIFRVGEGDQENEILRLVDGKAIISGIISGSSRASIGSQHTFLANNSSILGGNNNAINSGANCSVIAGGKGNKICANDCYAVIGGGRTNCVDADYSAVVGGYSNEVVGACGFIGGGYANATNSACAAIAGGRQNKICNSTGGFIGGGKSNTICSVSSGFCAAVIGGGNSNHICDALNATIAGGATNCVHGSGNAGTIAGGACNFISGSADGTFIGGGFNNSGSQAACAAILGGCGNIANHTEAMIIGSNITSQGSCTTFVNNLAFYPYSGNGNLVLGTAEASGEIAYWGTGTVEAGKVYQLKQLASDSRTWVIAHADDEGESSGMLALALGDGTARDVGMLLRGYARFTSTFALTSTNAGSKVYLSDATEGLITATAPSSTNDVVRIVGYVIDKEEEAIYFSPDNTYVVVS